MTKKDKNKKQEIATAIFSKIGKFGEANAEHLKSYDTLNKISKSKINPEYAENNYRQQAGKAAEVKHTARTNADNIIGNKSKRIARTDDTGNVNHKQYDHVQVDNDGKPILNKDGTFKSGSQQKTHKNVDSYKQYYKDSAEFEKYKNGDLNVPSDQVEEIKKNFDKDIANLEKQEKNLRNNGQIDKANQKKEQIERAKHLKKRIRPAKVSQDEAIEARKNPEISVAKDVFKINHQAGVENAKNGALIRMPLSVIKNTISVYKGEKGIKEASADCIKETLAGGASDYIKAFIGSFITGLFRSSEKPIIRALGKGNAPLIIMQSSISVSKHATDLIKGKITFKTFLQNILEDGVRLGAGIYGSAQGVKLGGLISSGGGAVIGGFIGAVIVSQACSHLIKDLKEISKNKKLSAEKRQQVKEQCEYLIQQEIEYRQYIETVYGGYLKQKKESILNGFEKINLSIQNGEPIDEGLSMIAAEYNLELKFKNNEEFKEYLENNKVLYLG